MELQEAFDKGFEAVKGYIDRSFEAFEARIAALEVQVKALSEKSPFEYMGVFEPRKAYKRGQFVTHGGSMWACMADTTMQSPGDGPGWQLAVKRGRDGKDV